MPTFLQRVLAIVVMAMVAVPGAAMAIAWSPASTGLIAPASAQEDGDDDDDDGDGDQVPVGGVATGQGATAGDDDDDDDGDGAHVPVGGVATGLGGSADSWTAEPASSERSTGAGDVIGVAAPLGALALGGITVGRMAIARLGGRRA
jgi:hypothetical protein